MFRHLLFRGVVRLHPFLLSQLERATNHNKQQQQNPAAAVTVSRAEMHPVLYPILLLLARLKVGGGSNGMEAGQVKVVGTLGCIREGTTRGPLGIR